MAAIRKAGWFLALAIMMAGWMGALGSFRGVAVAGVIASRGAEANELRAAETAKIQAFLESKVVLQKLMDYGVSKEEAMAKIRSMSDTDLHRLASLTDRAVDGGDTLGVLIGLAILVILVIVIMKLLNKEIIVR